MTIYIVKRANVPVAEATEYYSNKVTVSGLINPYPLTVHDNLEAAKRAYPDTQFQFVTNSGDFPPRVRA